jgi:hypothetical protein
MPSGLNRKDMATARELGVNKSSVRSRIATLQKATVFPSPSGHAVHGVSTLYNADGAIAAQWVKSRAAQRTPEEWAEHVRDALADVEPNRVIPSSKQGKKELLTVYPIGDHHVAMYAWGEEVGNDYDIKTAERLLISAANHLVEVSPPSDTAIIINVGDFFHVDNIKNETARSGHTQDVDTRYAAMIRAGVKMLRQIIETALIKHRLVKVISAIGNHDDIGAQWLALALSLFYEKNPRVEVDTKPGKFHYHQHGKCLIGVTHGDTARPERLQGVMAADVPALWGATTHRHWITGHVHNKSIVEFPGVTWETVRTLAPADAWAHAAGYRAGRDMQSIVFHAEFGEIARHRFNVSMLK